MNNTTKRSKPKQESGMAYLFLGGAILCGTITLVLLGRLDVTWLALAALTAGTVLGIWLFRFGARHAWVTLVCLIAAVVVCVALLANVEDIKGQRDRIVSELTEMGLQPAESDANFVLFGGLENPRKTWQGLLDAGVLIRDVGIPGHLRVTAGTEAETTAFLTRLRELLSA